MRRFKEHRSGGRRKSPTRRGLTGFWNRWRTRHRRTGTGDAWAVHRRRPLLEPLEDRCLLTLAAPALIAPIPFATGLGLQPQFSWSAVSSEAGNTVAGYRLIVSNYPGDLPTNPDQSGGAIADGFNVTLGQDVTSYTPTIALSSGIPYYWEVHALGSTAGGEWSEVNTFNTALFYESTSDILDDYGSLCQYDSRVTPNGDVSCGPTALANSLIYLHNRYDLDLGVGFTEVQDYSVVCALGTSSYMNVQAGVGVTDTDFINGRNAWLAQSGFSTVYVADQAINVDGTVPTVPTADFICRQLSLGADVEVGLNWTTGGGHWITATGINFDPITDTGSLSFIDPADGTTHTGTLSLDPNSYTYNGTIYNGFLDLTYGGQTGYIDIVATERSPLICPVDFDDIVDVFNLGIQGVRQSGNLSSIANSAFDADLPLVEQSVAGMASAAERFSTPFLQDIGSSEFQLSELAADVNLASAEPLRLTDNDSTTWDLTALRDELVALGFEVQYLSLTPDAAGDLMRVSYTQTWAAASAPLDFDFTTGFDYFDSGVVGSLEGNVSAALEPVTLNITMGVDASDGVPTFYVSEDSSLCVGGISVAGSVSTNMAIRNLLDVDVSGLITGSLSGALTFSDPDADTKLRISQLTTGTSIVQSSLSGSLSFNPTLTAHLPVIGPISWDGVWEATLANGVVSVGAPTLTAPSIASVKDLLEGAYRNIAGAFDLFGGVDLSTSLPVVDTGLGEVLGLPSLLTGGGVGGQGFQVNVTPEAVQELINGNVVDLIRFEMAGGDRWSTGFSVPIAAAAIPLGPIPLTMSLSLNTEIEAGWNYYVGMGVDTVGFYIDPGTSISASGSVLAGLAANVSIAGIAGMEVSAGVGASVSMTVGFQDPDPRDGRIYLDELLAYRDMSLGDSLLNAMYATLGGEAFGYAKGVVSFLFWDWEVFNERFTIASFASQLSSDERTPVANPNSQRQVTGRSPLGTGTLEDSLLENGVLTIDTRIGGQSDKANCVSITDAGEGKIDVTWRGVGHRIYEPGQIQSIVYLGNEQADRFYVGEGVLAPVEAYGNGGCDLITVLEAPATIYGGAGNDILRGGLAADVIWGGVGDDQLYGGGDNDELHGDGGSDRLEGGDGMDQLFGDAGLDILIGGAENDTLFGGSDNDVLYGGLGNDTLEGEDGRDILYGEQGEDTLRGGDQDDTLIGGADRDWLYGGDGSDTLFGDRGYAEPSADEPDGDDFLYGQGGDDRLFGEGGDDVLEGDDAGQTGQDLLVGDGGMDTLYGGGGDDRLLGGDGNDWLYGGDGDDVLNGNGGADVLFGDAGNDTLQIDFASTDGVSVDEMHGGLDRDQLAVVGTVQQVVVDGQPILDSNIDDYIQIEQLSGDDFQAISRNPVDGGVLQTFSFTLDSSPSGDIEQLGIQGLGGNDRLEVLTGPLAGKNLVLDGGAGNDTLQGGQGRDILYGGPGDDKLFGGDNDDVLYGDEGRDELDGGAGVDLVYAGPGGDTVLGGAGREVIRGGPDADILVAGTGFYGSIITGGNGDDVIIGSFRDRLARRRGWK